MGGGGGENIPRLTYTYNWSNNFFSFFSSTLLLIFTLFFPLYHLLVFYIYADLPVGKEVGALCIIFSHLFSLSLSLFNFSSTHSHSNRHGHPSHPLDSSFVRFLVSRHPFSPSLSILLIRSFSLSLLLSLSLFLFLSLPLAQLGSVCAERLSPVAPNSVPKSQFAWISSQA